MIDRLGTVGKRAVNDRDPQPLVRFTVNEPGFALFIERLELRILSPHFATDIREVQVSGASCR